MKKSKKDKKRENDNLDDEQSIEMHKTETALDSSKQQKRKHKKKKKHVREDADSNDENHDNTEERHSQVKTEIETSDIGHSKKLSKKGKNRSSDQNDSADTQNDAEKTLQTSDTENETNLQEEKEDPEKAAMRERKRKKRQEKKAAKKQKLDEAEAAKGTGAPLALEYLQKWDSDRSHWTFQKVRQVWLLQNMYDTDKIPPDQFPVLLRYLEGLKGQGRKTTVEKAEKLLASAESDSDEEKDAEDEDSDDEGDNKNTKSEKAKTDETKAVKFSEEQYERVRQVIQLLS